MAPRTHLPVFTSGSDSRNGFLQGLLTAVIITGALYVAREVLVPLALAVLLSFILTPPLLALRRWMVPRVLSVTLVVGAAVVVIIAVGWLMSYQVTELAENLPAYQQTLGDKLNALRSAATGSPLLGRATAALQGLQTELANPKPETKVGTMPPPPAEAQPEKAPIPVEIRNPESRPIEVAKAVLGTLLPPLATAGLVLLFVIFILIQREDLRDRMVSLFGMSDLQRSATAITDAATRLSHYFLIQFLMNSAYGTFITFGLWLIGIPSPIVWGILAMLMRFVPYVGSYIAALFPLLLAAVVEPGWTTFLLTGALFLVSEMIMGQVIEPLAFGRGTGLSPIAVVISTVFWTWLWGPLGLILATPLTVCLFVLSRHVEGLHFLEVLLADEPALTPQQSFYQRLLSGDSAEATYHAELCLREEPLMRCLDGTILEALQLAERDAERGALDDDHLERIRLTIGQVLENLEEFEPKGWFRKAQPDNHDEDAEPRSGLASLDEAEAEMLPVLAPDDIAPGWQEEGSILCIGTRTPLDDAVAEMLALLLKKHGLPAKSVESDALSTADMRSLGAGDAKLVCLSYLGVGGTPVHVRYVVRRLRRILPPDCIILVGCWTDQPGNSALKSLKSAAEADAYVTSLREALEFCLKAARLGDQSREVPPQEQEVA